MYVSKPSKTYHSVHISGNLVSWETAHLETHNMEHSEQNLREMCEPQKPFFAVIATWQPMWDMKMNCDKLNGQMPKMDNSPGLNMELERLIPQKRRPQSLFSEMYNMHCVIILSYYDTFYVAYSEFFWNGWTDEKEEGIFRNVYTGEKMPQEMWNNFPPGNPDGGTSENCLISWFEGNEMPMTDISCNDAWAVAFCELRKMPQLTMRGLEVRISIKFKMIT